MTLQNTVFQPSGKGTEIVVDSTNEVRQRSNVASKNEAGTNAYHNKALEPEADYEELDSDKNSNEYQELNTNL